MAFFTWLYGRRALCLPEISEFKKKLDYVLGFGWTLLAFVHKNIKKNSKIVDGMDEHEKKKKRERGPNFTPGEKAKVLNLISKYKPIIDCKETNTMVTAQKKKAWLKICTEYNPHATTGPRNWIQLRNLYDCLKQQAKKSNTKPNKKDYKEILEKSYQLLDDSNAMSEEYPADEHKDNESQQLNVTDYLEVTDNEDTNASQQISITDNEEEDSTAEKMPEMKPFNSITDDEEEGAEEPPEKKPYKRNRATQQARKSDEIKEKYFQLKLENAQLEQKFMILENERKQQLHDLKIKLLKEELQQFMK